MEVYIIYIQFYGVNISKADAELTTGESVKIPVVKATCISNVASDIEINLN